MPGDDDFGGDLDVAPESITTLAALAAESKAELEGKYHSLLCPNLSTNNYTQQSLVEWKYLINKSRKLLSVFENIHTDSMPPFSTEVAQAEDIIGFIFTTIRKRYGENTTMTELTSLKI